MTITPALVLTAVGTAVSAVGAIQQGNAAKKAGAFNAAVAENNAIAARQTAKANADREERLGRKRMGSLSANIGASGITKEGTALDVMEDLSKENALAVLDIIHAGELDALGFANNANIARMSGDAAQTTGFLKAGGALLLGGEKIHEQSGGSLKLKTGEED